MAGWQSASHAWLVERPIAHRGLHDRSLGRVENSLSAALAAIAAGIAIECDVQLSADGEAVVFHDRTLDRLTGESGAVHSRTAKVLGQIALEGGIDRIPTLPTLLDAINGRVPLICEIKSAFDGDHRLARRVRAIAQHYSGPLALKSFDPAVIVALREADDAGEVAVPIGIVAEARYDESEWSFLTLDRKRDLAALAHFGDTRPDFLSYAVADLPHAATTLFRLGVGKPVMSWTVRTAAQRERAGRWADQMVFEGFLP